MLKLYYSPGACSLVPHIALEEAGAELTALRIPIAEGGHLKPEYLAINPHARLPSLGTDRGIITENIAVLTLSCRPLYRCRGRRVMAEDVEVRHSDLQPAAIRTRSSR